MGPDWRASGALGGVIVVPLNMRPAIVKSQDQTGLPGRARPARRGSIEVNEVTDQRESLVRARG